MTPFVSYCVNTFNRLPFLQNLIKSFDLCNIHQNYQWVITDYGSKDGTREWLLELSRQCSNVVAVLEDEDFYFEQLESIGMAPVSRRKRAHAIFGLAKNHARLVSHGDIIVELSDDHQFVRKGDWISGALSVFSHHEEITGKDDISTIIYRGLSLERILKSNNETDPVQISATGVEYFVAKQKCYDDYCIAKRKTLENIGPFLQVENITDKKQIKAWQEGNDDVNHYSDYLKRTKDMGLKKVFLKYPYSIQFGNNSGTPPVGKSGLFVEPISLNAMKEKFGNLQRQISTEEIISLSLSK